MQFLNPNQNQLISKFIEICQKHKIWYSIDLKTLLSAHRFNDFSIFNHRFEVMMTIDSYFLLVRFAPQHVVDSFLNDKYKLFTASFVEDSQAWQKEGAFISIRILIPSTIKKIKTFNSRIFHLKMNVLKGKFNLRHAINYLYETKYDGFYLLDKCFKNIQKNWTIRLNYETKLINFGIHQVMVVNNYEYLLQRWFGSSWKYSLNHLDTYKYLSPIKKIKYLDGGVKRES